MLLENDILTGRYSQKQVRVAIADVTAACLDHLRAEQRKPGTINKYQAVFAKLHNFAERHRLLTLDQFDSAMFDRYRRELVSADRAPKTIDTESTILRTLINPSPTRQMIAASSLRGVRIKAPKPAQPCFSRDQVEQIIAASREPQRSIFIVLANTGARIGEIKWLTWKDVDFRNNRLHIRPKDDWTPKSGDQRAIPTTDRVQRLLQKRQREFRWVLTAGKSKKYPRGGNQISERRLLVSLKRVLRKLGIEGHLHTFRHAYISHALSHGVPEPVVRAIVGHVDEKVIRLYTHIADARMQHAARVFNQSPNRQ